jgi:hypothetical protein
VSAAIDLRVALRPFAPADGALVEPWLSEAWAAVDGGRSPTGAALTLDGLEALVAERWPGAELAAIVRQDGAPLGFVAWRTKPSVAAVETEIVALAVRAARRNLGLGGEAVQALERLRPGGRFLAAIPRGNGLAVYFWLRTGYCPVRPDEDDARARDPNVLWMARSEMEEVSDAPPGP